MPKWRALEIDLTRKMVPKGLSRNLRSQKTQTLKFPKSIFYPIRSASFLLCQELLPLQECCTFLVYKKPDLSSKADREGIEPDHAKEQVPHRIMARTSHGRSRNQTCSTLLNAPLSSRTLLLLKQLRTMR